MGCTCEKQETSGNINFDERNDNFKNENDINDNLNENIENNIINGNENENNENNKTKLKSVKKNNRNENNDIIIKNFYEKINQSNDYEIITLDTIQSLLSQDTINSYQYYQNNKNKFNIEEKNEENNIPNSFKMGIRYSNKDLCDLLRNGKDVEIVDSDLSEIY